MRGTLTRQRYVDDILRSHVGPFLNGLPGALFQQDNARPHAARIAQDFPRHFQTLPWPARSPDLKNGTLTQKGSPPLVYADKPQTLDHLEENIRRVIADIRPQMLEKVIENWTSRLDYIRASRGSHMPEIIFKM
ncbi:DDE_3 domain-containing protein [Trichonephila clavipes]|nr:DDE_3 domain-containing protein [Trichonephila clavipes]